MLAPECCGERLPQGHCILGNDGGGWFTLWMADQQVATVSHGHYQHRRWYRRAWTDAVLKATHAVAVTATHGVRARA
ncbi:MAG: hypothetical protein LC799_07880 [Actinobacteria bacterium]|nr:hypothetical protein [Actinomycetota bacterium]